MAGPAGAQTWLSFDPPAASFGGADQQTVAVVATQTPDLLGFSLVVAYDPAVLELVAVTAGDLVVGAACSHFLDWELVGGVPGQLRVDLAMFGCTTTGDGSLVQLVFAGVGAGTSPLTMVSGELRDATNQSVPFSAEDGVVTYLPQPGEAAFAPDPAAIGSDGTAEVCVELAGIGPIQGASLEFSFDPAVVVPTAVTPGSLLVNAPCSYFMNWLNEDGFSDMVAIDVALLGCLAAGEGPIVCITFEGVAEGTSPLAWLDLDVRDGNNAPVPVTAVDGTIYFDPTVAAEAVSWSAVKKLYR